MELRTSLKKQPTHLSRNVDFEPCNAASWWARLQKFVQKLLKIFVRGRSQDAVTRFCLFFDHLPPSIDIVYGIIVDKRGHFWTTYLPHLVNVVCERPLSPKSNRKLDLHLLSNEILWNFTNMSKQMSLEIENSNYKSHWIYSKTSKIYLNGKMKTRIESFDILWLIAPVMFPSTIGLPL